MKCAAPNQIVLGNHARNSIVSVHLAPDYFGDSRQYGVRIICMRINTSIERSRRSAGISHHPCVLNIYGQILIILRFNHIA